jgi:nucleoside-diphosphate-sugar epimerase
MRLLLTGADGFTGQHLTRAAQVAKYEVFALAGDLQDASKVKAQVDTIKPTHVIHLAGISHVTGEDAAAYYGVNLLGSLNLLTALKGLALPPAKVILASTANVYGNHAASPISEQEAPAPISHYSMSKLAIEYMSRPFLEYFPIVITRPFNYTGVGHDVRFVIPKIIAHFQKKAPGIELGNIDVLREYNDVRDVCAIYLQLLSLGQSGQTYNIASNRVYALREVLTRLEKLSGQHMTVTQNPQFLRANEIFTLAGDPRHLEACIGPIAWRLLDDTLQWMLSEWHHGAERTKTQFLG